MHVALDPNPTACSWTAGWSSPVDLVEVRRLKCLAALQQSEGDGRLDEPHPWITPYDNVDKKLLTMQ